jgi:saccharopine dehydrogenase (NAD+, L-lysine-forming)
MPAQLATAHARTWALFGATGMTGRMVLARTLAKGHHPDLLGRDSPALAALARETGLSARPVRLDDTQTLVDELEGRPLVLNVAGPFTRTGEPLIQAAMAAGADYIDLNGELPALERLLALDEEARQAGMALIGGAGFGVAATDGLAAQVSERLGGAVWLRLGVAADSAFSSPAVGESTLAVLAGGGFEVEGGELVPRAIARRRWRIRLPDGGRLTFASAPLAELAAVHRATGASAIVAGAPIGSPQAAVLSALAPLLPRLLRIPAVRRRLAAAGGHAGASGAPAARVSRVIVEGGKGGRKAAALLEGGEGYALAADIAALAIEALLAERPPPGAYTPATAFGPNFISRAPGVRITHDLDM